MFTLTIFIGSLICVGDFGSKNICKTLFIVSKISFLWYALYGAVTTFVVGYLTSFIFKPPLFYQIDGLVLGLKRSVSGFRKLEHIGSLNELDIIADANESKEDLNYENKDKFVSNSEIVIEKDNDNSPLLKN